MDIPRAPVQQRASKAAAAMLLSGKEISYVELHTPKGINLRLEVLDISREDNAVSCAIQKDGGDDPDVTNGILIYAKVSRSRQMKHRSSLMEALVLAG